MKERRREYERVDSVRGFDVIEGGRGNEEGRDSVLVDRGQQQGGGRDGGHERGDGLGPGVGGRTQLDRDREGPGWRGRGRGRGGPRGDQKDSEGLGGGLGKGKGEVHEGVEDLGGALAERAKEGGAELASEEIDDD